MQERQAARNRGRGYQVRGSRKWSGMSCSAGHSCHLPSTAAHQNKQSMVSEGKGEQGAICRSAILARWCSGDPSLRAQKHGASDAGWGGREAHQRAATATFALAERRHLEHRQHQHEQYQRWGLPQHLSLRMIPMIALAQEHQRET